ncbi:uncharacterized protein F4822DRAFT_414582 [Hypoxylon trugodes]|uniref:uncharacterized protein n=1 Tax=Hypoxylon trugodes TaxID=326681 RepID=UPI0021923074|nr:uncharacterized protein F4822DRAFT_414582 [Hypoxylon trugodes]KAI1385952.1 hypothetical protein F4822DRAFT_414582 [Hypoxylon trugodes]
MSTLTEMPCEIIISVLRELDDVRFLLPSLLTCHYVYSCFKQNPGVAVDILQRQIHLAIIPYSVAVLEATRLDPRYDTDVYELLGTLYTEPSKFTERLRTMPVPLLARMGHVYELIHTFATEFASSAWTHLSTDQESEVAGSLVLSPSEYIRFLRNFYRVELYFCLFRSAPNTPFREQLFFFNQPPWETEQVACVHDFLELKLSKASYDVLAHDVELGELEIDYITAGDNQFRQLWLSQGVDFTHKLTSESSYDDKKSLLKSAFGGQKADLYDKLIEPLETDLDDHTPLSGYTEKDLAAEFTPMEGQDTDKGPFEAWRVTFNPLPPSAWVMLTNNSGLRERAYVLWDLDRIEKYGLLKLFDNAPKDSELQHTPNDYDEMNESFKERSEICRKGGSGHWSKNDESRIVWSK